MRIIGVDPGLGCTGYGVLEAPLGKPLVLLEAGVIRTRAKDPLSDRLSQLYTGIRGLIVAYLPQAVAIEDLYSSYKNPRTAIVMAHARGVIYLAAGESKIEVSGYPARRVKQSVAGNGAASKLQIQRMVCKMLQLNNDPQPFDVTDALALAIAHAACCRRRTGKL